MTFLKNAAVYGVLAAACAWLLPTAFPAPAQAQEDGAAPPVELEEIVVIGSRRDPRTVLESAVPVDVLGADDLRSQGSTDMDDMLRTLHPSYNISRHGIDDEATLVRPATLRGLPPDSAMVLLNGKRRHRSGVIALLGSSLNSGSQGPDLSVIPSIALRQVELLRDGASAQYGADAIAGVLNFQLREDSEGIDLEARIGQYLHESDGELIHLAGNFGFELTSAGFFNLSLEYRDAADTVRSGTRGNARFLGQRGYPLKDPAQIWGSPDTRDAMTLFFNSGIELTPDVNAYAFGGWHQRESEGGFFLRAPGTTTARGGVFQSGGERLVVPRLDAEGNLPARFEPRPGMDERWNSTECEATLPPLADISDDAPDPGDNFSAVQSYIAANPDCFLFNEMFPGGFTPRFGADVSDWSIVLGLKGGVNDLRWDFSVGAARSEVDFFLNNSINASLGPDTPTSFDPRAYIQEEMSANLDFVQPLEVGAFSSPLNIAFGLEWREETFTSEAGDEASYIDGPYSQYGFSIGSNGYQGLLPKAAGEWDRPNFAAYIDLEADVTERLLVGVAARYEDFYDDFGDTLKGKLALSYELTPGLRLRGTVSSGFRAPSPGQANLSVLSTSFTDVGGGDLLVESGQLPPTDPIAAALGGEPLKEEESVNYSAGLAWRISDRMTLTFDYFRIEVEDRVSLTGQISLDALQLRDCNNAAATAVVAFADCVTNTVVTATSVAEDTFGGATVRRVRFYANDFDTTTQGLDLVLTWSPAWSVETDIDLAWNWTETEVDSFSENTINCFPRANGGCDPLVTEMGEDSGVYVNTPNRVQLLTPRRQNEIEDLNPEHRIVLTSRHRLGDLSGMLRLSRYSSWKACRFQTTSCQDGDGNDAYDSFAGAWIFDMEIGYDIDERTSVAFGIQNLFDEFPDAHPLETAGQGNLHPASTPWDYNGTFGYVRFSSKF